MTDERIDVKVSAQMLPKNKGLKSVIVPEEVDVMFSTSKLLKDKIVVTAGGQEIYFSKAMLESVLNFLKTI